MKHQRSDLLKSGLKTAAIGSAGLWAVSHGVYHRSVSATLLGWGFRLSEFQKTFRSAQRADESELKAAKTNMDVSIPAAVGKMFNITESQISGMKVLDFKPSGHAAEKSSPLKKCASPRKKCVIFFHGGAYYEPPMIVHYMLAHEMANKTGAEVIMPLYPLAPEFTYRAAYPLLDGFYDEVLERYDHSSVIFFGDSAGGGLAVGLALRLAENEKPIPSKLILASPWLDLTLKNPAIGFYAKLDPLLAVPGHSEVGRIWAGGDDPDNYLLSPINGDMSLLPPTTVFAGTREIFCPDAITFASNLERAGRRVELYLSRGSDHDYVIFPTAEAGKARKKIFNAIRND